MMKARQKLNIGIWILVIIVILLLSATTAVLAMRLGGYLPENVDVIFLEPRDPDLWVEDESGKKWTQNETVEIFSMQYVDENGDVIIRNNVDEGGIIAPGAESSYKFYLKNASNFALDYSIELSPKLLQHSHLASLSELPIEVRVHNQSGDFLIGSDSDWVMISNAPTVVDSGTVGINSYYSYVLEWRWLFESGDDVRDTLLGNMTIEDPIIMQVDLGMTAEENTNLAAQGGFPLAGDLVDSQAAGTIRVIPMILLILLLLASAAALVLLILRRRKTDKT